MNFYCREKQRLLRPRKMTAAAAKKLVDENINLCYSDGATEVGLFFMPKMA
jgi:hypothetical protein